MCAKPSVVSEARTQLVDSKVGLMLGLTRDLMSGIMCVKAPVVPEARPQLVDLIQRRRRQVADGGPCGDPLGEVLRRPGHLGRSDV